MMSMDLRRASGLEPGREQRTNPGWGTVGEGGFVTGDRCHLSYSSPRTQVSKSHSWTVKMCPCLPATVCQHCSPGGRTQVLGSGNLEPYSSMGAVVLKTA